MRSIVAFLLVLSVVSAMRTAARADDPGLITIGDAVAAIGQPVAPEDSARLEDISATEGTGFSDPTTVYRGGVYLDAEDEALTKLPFNTLIFVQGDTTVGVEMIYMPQDVNFSDMTLDAQQELFDALYVEIADNYAGDSGGTLSFDDKDQGGLYDYTDANGISYSLAWIPNQELSLTFDSPDFVVEHTAHILGRDLDQLESELGDQ